MSLSGKDPKRARTDDGVYQQLALAFVSGVPGAKGKRIWVREYTLSRIAPGRVVDDALLARAISLFKNVPSYPVFCVSIDLPIAGHLSDTLRVILDNHSDRLTDVEIKVPCDTHILADILNRSRLGQENAPSPLRYEHHSLSIWMPSARDSDPRTVYDGPFWDRLVLPGLRRLCVRAGSAPPPIQAFTDFLSRHRSLHQFEISGDWGAEAGVVKAIWRHLDTLEQVDFAQDGGRYADNVEPLAVNRVFYLRAVAEHLEASAFDDFWDRRMSADEKKRIVEAKRAVRERLAVDAVERRFFENKRADPNLLVDMYRDTGGWMGKMASGVRDRARNYPDTE